MAYEHKRDLTETKYENNKTHSIEGICNRDGCDNEIPPGRSAYCSNYCSRLVKNNRLYDARRRETSEDNLRYNSQEKIRTCLQCSHHFPSDGPWNRICSHCTRNSRAPPRARAVHVAGEKGTSVREYVDGNYF